MLVSFLPFLFRWPALSATPIAVYTVRKVVAATKFIQTVTDTHQVFHSLLTGPDRYTNMMKP